MNKLIIKSQLFVVFAAILWGTTGTAQYFAPDSIGPLGIGAIRMLIGGSMLFVGTLIKGSLRDIKKMNFKDVMIAILCMSIYQPLFFFGVLKTGVATGTVVALGSAPIYSGIIDNILGKKTSKLWLSATMISITGCIVLFYGKGSFTINWLGILCATGAGLAYAVYVIFNQRLLSKNSLDLTNSVVFLGSALVLSPLLFRINFGLIDLGDYSGIFALLFLGICSTALAYTLFALGLKHLKSSTAVTLTLVEPLTASILGIFLLNEPFTVISYMGIFLIFIGLVLNCLPQRLKS